MTTQTEALTLALEAFDDRTSLMKWQIARDAVREALAQPEQELDYKAIGQQAYESGYSTGYMDCAVKMKAQPEQEPVARVVEHGATVKLEWASADAAHNAKVGNLYTTPPQRTWVGLTDDEIEMIVENKRAAHWEFVRQVEAKLKEKNT